ncbi:MAG: hypothetical protein J7493_16200 [Porphyrobacter sp.]|nr:hypothetical protein [Porphyrobacter sp.]
MAMTRYAVILPVLLGTLAAGCHAKAPDAASRDQTASTSQNAANASAQLQRPSPALVLGSIYQAGGSIGDTSPLPLENGSEANFWYGHEFELNGKRYYTGFAYNTPAKYSREESYPAPDAQVTLTQATFVLRENDGEPAWSFEGAEPYIGEFGSYENADTVDAARQVKSHATVDGRLLLAIPTKVFHSGNSSLSYALFLFVPGEQPDVDAKSWTYLGSVAAGEENSAACDDGIVMPCISSIGTLTFTQRRGGGLPDIRIAMTGTTIKARNTARKLGPEDAVSYSYDSQTKTYQVQ